MRMSITANNGVVSSIGKEVLIPLPNGGSTNFTFHRNTFSTENIQTI